MKDWEGNFELVNPRVVVVDHRYQRPEKPALIAAIAKAPNWRAFGVVVCAKRPNGMLYCFDGQQRLKGLLESEEPPKLVPAVWFPVATPQEEADLFVLVNFNRKGVRAIEKWDARIFAKHPVYLIISKVVEECGLSVGDGTRSISPGVAERMYNRTGEAGLALTLAPIKDVWGDDGLSTHGQLLEAVNIAISEFNGELDRGKVTAALRRTDPTKIVQKANQLQYDLGGAKTANMVRAVRELTRLGK